MYRGGGAEQEHWDAPHLPPTQGRGAALKDAHTSGPPASPVLHPGDTPTSAGHEPRPLMGHASWGPAFVSHSPAEVTPLSPAPWGLPSCLATPPGARPGTVGAERAGVPGGAAVTLLPPAAGEEGRPVRRHDLSPAHPGRVPPGGPAAAAGPVPRTGPGHPAGAARRGRGRGSHAGGHRLPLSGHLCCRWDLPARPQVPHPVPGAWGIGGLCGARGGGQGGPSPPVVRGFHGRAPWEGVLH